MKNVNYRYIALDMDGTILDRNFILSPLVSDTLSDCRKLGKKVIIATGRVYASTKKHIASIGSVDGFVCSNGADVYDGSGSIIAQTHMDDGLSRRLVAISRDCDSHFHAFIGDSWYYEREKAYTSLYIRRSGFEGEKVNFDNYRSLAFTKCMFMDDHGKLEAIKTVLDRELGNRAQIMFSAPFMLEIVVNGVNKSTGLRACVENSGGSLDEVIAFGDAENDEDMLLAVGHGVAMGNAHDELKAKVDAVTLSVDDDGVAVYLRDFFGLA